MNRKFIQQLVQMGGTRDQLQGALKKRRDEILGAIGDRTLEPSEQVMKELFELNVAIGDVPEEGEDFHD
jgi:hypothetical protein